MNAYAEWLQRMPQDERIVAWQVEGRSKGYMNGEMDPHLRSGIDKLVTAYAGRPALKVVERPAEGWPEPEDRGAATLSALGTIEYVEDLIRPGRIVVWAAEEGSGKSFAVDDELSMRVAVAGGSFAGTWPVNQTGPVLVLSEMHADDDYAREETTLGSLGLKRVDLTGHYFRLSLMTAANGRPALTVPEWRMWVTGWLRDHGAILLVIDTATGATQVDPWGAAIQEVFTNLRLMLAEYPELAIVLLIHLKKPQGRGERRISDLLGEWGRWCDVVILMENDGASLERTKITVRKRVRRERRIVATKAGGLLVDPVDADAGKTTKIPAADVLAAIEATPGIGLAELGRALGVSKDTAGNYVSALETDGQVVSRSVGPRRTKAIYPAETTAEPPNTAERAQIGGLSAVKPPEPGNDRRSPNPYLGIGGRSSVVSDPGPKDQPAVPTCDRCGHPKVEAHPGRWVCTNAPGHELKLTVPWPEVSS